jgi:hypothetical protein
LRGGGGWRGGRGRWRRWIEGLDQGIGLEVDVDINRGKGGDEFGMVGIWQLGIEKGYIY